MREYLNLVLLLIEIITVVAGVYKFFARMYNTYISEVQPVGRNVLLTWII